MRGLQSFRVSAVSSEVREWMRAGMREGNGREEKEVGKVENEGRGW